MANRKVKKLCVYDIRSVLEEECESESDFSLSESEFDFVSSSSSAQGFRPNVVLMSLSSYFLR
jgi:hypothetical protein